MKTTALPPKRSVKTLLLILILSMAGVANAHPVDMNLAREVGAKFINANTRMNVTSGENLQLVTTYSTSHGDAAFHVFNTPQGFVIVSADNCATPILGYSDEGRPFDPNNVPIQMQEYLQRFVEQIEYGIENQIEADETIAQQWTMVMQDGRLNPNRTTTVVEPLLTTTWNQGCYYNSLCPEDPDGQCGHVWAGCVATAIGQIMNYWGYPSNGQGSHTYTPNGYPEQTANFGATSYEWSLMPNALTASSTSTQINAVATLLYHIGVASDMNYGASGSGAYDSDAADALVNYFKYSEDQSLEYKRYRVFNPGIGFYQWYDHYTDEEWLNMVKESLDLGRPVYYSAASGSDAHAFVLDGYDANDYWHINWGWGGQGDAYFAYGALNVTNYQFNTNPWMIRNIHPQCNPEAIYTITANSFPSGSGTVTGAGNYPCSDFYTLTATPNEGYTFLYWTENDSIISRISSISFMATETRTFTAHFAVNFTVETEPETYGSYSVEGASLVPIGPSVYTRVTDVSELMPGDRIIFASRYNDIANQYAAMRNTVDPNQNIRFPTTLFTSQNNGNDETLSADIVNQEYDYYWTLGITEEGYYTFTNSAGQVLSIYDSWAFSMNGGNRYWAIVPETSGANAMIPNYAGFTISGINTDSGFALSELDGNYYCYYGSIGYDNSEYNFYFDIFRQPCEVYTAPYGSNVTLTATPNEYKSFLNWTKDGVEVSTDAVYSFSNTENANYVAHFIGDPVVTVNVNPENCGQVFAHISDVNQLSAGDQIILVARYDNETNHYAALQNTLNANGFIPTTLYTTDDMGDITSDIDSYFWTVGITDEGYFTFSNTEGQTLGASWYWNAYFSMAGTNTTWNISTGTAGPNAMVPNWSGFIISNTNADRAIALCSDLFCRYWANNYDAGDCTFFFDILKVPSSNGMVYPYNSTVNLTAVADEGYTFTNWTKDGEIVGTENTYTFTITDDVNLVAHFITNPVISISVEPEGSGTISLEGLELMHDSTYRYTRISDINEIHNGDRIIMAARYNDNANEYVALKNTLDGRLLRTTGFTSQVDNGDEIIPASFSDDETYCWTVGITDEGNYMFTDTEGNTISLYSWRQHYFNYGNNINWIVSSGVSDFDAMVPEYEGFTIINVTDPAYGFAISSNDGIINCSAVATTCMIGSESPNYNFYFDFFKLSTNHYTCDYGETVSMTATPNMNYTFLNWTKNGNVVSTETTYSFTATENADYVANFIADPTISVAVNPEEYGTFHIDSYENLTPTDGLYHYVRINDLEALADGDKIILAAHYNQNNTQYQALNNTLDANGMIPTTYFVSTTNDNDELLPSTIADNDENYLWTVSINNGNYFFVNTAGDTIGYNSSMYFNMNGDNTGWALASGVSDAGAMVPNHTGFTITNVNTTNRAIALYSDLKCGAYHTSYMTGSNASSYNFYLDIFHQENVEITSYTGICGYGSTLSMTATPNEGYYFTNWTKNGQAVGTETSLTIVATEDAEYVAHFAENPEITVESSAGGTFRFASDEHLANKLDLVEFVRISDTATLVDGDRIIFASRAASDPAKYYYAMRNFSTGNSVSFNGNHWFTRLFVEDKEVFPINEKEDYYWTVGVAGDNYTFTNPNGDLLGSNTYFQWNGNNTTWSIATGTSPSHFTISDYTGYLISNVNNPGRAIACFLSGTATRLECVSLSTTDNRYNFYLDIFKAYHKDLTTYSSACHYGATLTVTATPDTGYTFVNWTKNGNEVSTDPTFSFTVTEDGDYVAHFEPDLNVITVAAYPENHGTVSGGGSFYTGDTCTLTATAASSDYGFTGWMKDGEEVSANPEYSFEVNESGTYVAQFSPVSDLLYTINSDSISVTVTGHVQGTDATGRLVIPERVIINAIVYMVTRIGNNAFKDCTGLTGSLVIPNTVTHIGNQSFCNCTGLDGSLTIPESVTYIGNETFRNCGFTTMNYNAINCEISHGYGYVPEWLAYCSSLTVLNIGSNVQVIPYGAFSKSYRFSTPSHSFSGNLVIPSSVTIIGEKAFMYDIFTGELVIPNSVTTIGAQAFAYCLFSGDLVIPNSVTSIGESAFASCGFTGNLFISSSLTTLESAVFSGCNGFRGELIIPNSVTSIGGSAFSGCQGFTGDLIIPNSVTSIGVYAFNQCRGFTGDLFIGNAVTTIGNNAFYDCVGFSGVLTIGESVTTIGYLVFYENNTFSPVNSFSQIRVLPMTPPTLGYQTFRFYSTPVFVPCGTLDAYQSTSTYYSWSSYFSNIQENCTEPVEITATANPAEGGTIEGTGFYTEGYNCTLTAIANEGYAFVYWTQPDGTVVSENASYTFTVTEAAAFVANFASEGLHWEVDPDEFPNSMLVTGVILIDSVEQYNPSWEIGAFHDNACRGSARLVDELRTNHGRLYFSITVYGNEEGEEISFLIYDHLLEQELDLDCTTTLDFAPGDSIGDPNNLFPINFVDAEITQTTAFTEGWNWWSTYIEQDGIDGLSFLEEGLGTNGIIIKSQSDGYTEYYDDYDLWYGSINAINNESSYMVKTSASCQVSMTGTAAMPSQHPITVDANGWTWIGYPVTYNMDINAALDGLASIEGDMLKAQEGYAEFYEGYGWYGPLETLTSGMGYMYKSNNASPTTFTYPSGSRGDAANANLSAKDNHWVPMASAYPFNMTVTAVVELDGEELRSDRYELAAFANGESRGSVRLMYVEPIDRYVAFLTIAGEEAADLSLSLYDTETGMECHGANETLGFEANATLGKLAEPFVVSFRGTTGMDELANSLRVYPNPVNAGERFRIGMNVESKAPVRVEIVNALGVTISVETSTQAPASIMAPATAGVYTLRVTVEGKGTAVRKLVVK